MKIFPVFIVLLIIASMIPLMAYFTSPTISCNETDTICNCTITPLPSMTPTPDPTPDKPVKYLILDDFNAMNEEIWQRSPYGGPHNTQFIPELTYICPEDGYLILTSNVNKHIGSQYETLDRHFYGKYKARIKVFNTPGTTLAFFTYKGPEPYGHHEIDIEFVKNGSDNVLHFSTYVQHMQNYYIYDLPFDPSEDFHDYAFYWYKDRVEFYVDDMEDPIWVSYECIPYEPCHVLFNSWVLNTAPDIDPAAEINTMYVDWIKVEAIEDYDLDA